MKKIILILLVLISANTLFAMSGYFKRLKVDDSLFAPARINAGSYYLNGVLITFGGSAVDTSLLLHKYNGTIFNARLSDSVFRLGYNLDTTKTPKLSMNNTFTGLNSLYGITTLYRKIKADTISNGNDLTPSDLEITAGDSIRLNSNTKLNNKTLSIDGTDKANVTVLGNSKLKFKSGGNDTIKVTDDYGLVFSTADTSRIVISNRGNLTFPNQINADGTWYRQGGRFMHTTRPFVTGSPDTILSQRTSYNLFLGYTAGSLTMTRTYANYWEGNYNTGIGYYSLRNLTSGYYNGGFGYNTLSSVTSGASNFGMGAFALQSITTGIGNTAIGGQAGLYLSTGSRLNTGIGSNVFTGVNGQSLCYNNVGIGSDALYSIKTGADRNIAIGTSSLTSLTTGFANIVIGNQSSDIYGTAAFTSAIRLQTGSWNILIGDTVKTTDSSSSRQLNIGKTIYGTGIYTDTARIGIEAINPHSTFQDSGSFALQYVSKTANYTVGEKDYCVNFTTAGDTAFIPTAVGKQGRIYIIKNSASSGTVVVDPFSTQTIDGVTTKSLTTQYSRVTIMSDNANWIILSE